MNYSELNEITVKTQEELDNVPKDFTGTVYIEFGTPFNRAIVRDRYTYRVEARGNSSVEARGNSSVVAWENSSVVAWGNSSVEAWGNSSVEAWGNSSVEARGNVQIVNCLLKGYGKIKISGNARIVYNPQNIHEYMDFYKLPHTKTYGTFYKAVHKVGGKYKSDYNSRFEYCIGGTVQSDTINTDISKSCGGGIHMAYLQWALDIGKDWDNLAILEVKAKLDDVIVPPNAGKVRVDKVEVIREVPLEECGLYGKILAKRRKNDERKSNDL